MTEAQENTTRLSPDQEVMGRLFVSGDPDDFQELVERFKKPVMKLVYRMTGDYEGSLEVAQETFIKAWRSRKAYDRKRPFTPWLFKIAANAASDFIAKKRAKGEEPLESAEGPGEGLQGCHWQDSVIGNISAQELLSKLDEPYRTALILRFVEDLTYDDIARVMETTAAQVKNYLFRGRQKLAGIAKEVLI
ncbi:MAG: RNA polymerase sigma factor [Candidatus Eremiobacteraeota bacterium]|nr:RNA polymerase sigma factor [Candidatus Eremiobacteraeota bacterium]